MTLGADYRRDMKVNDFPRQKNYILSLIIITKNEADRIETCLQSVAPIADEIVVLDSGSTDETVALAKKYTEYVYLTDWPGFGPQKQRALELAHSEWVLSIDADEVLSTELCGEIHTVLNSIPREVGFYLPRAMVLFGKTLRHGRTARAPLRLFRREGARFSDNLVHEKVLLPPGKIKKLKGQLLHYSIRDFEHYLQKNREYAWLGAQKRYQAGKKGLGLTGAVLRAFWTFIQIYFFKLGFLDGRPGFLVAVMYSQGSFNKYAGLWALRRNTFGGKKENKGRTN
jgi:glycosyltransferase involved in cell wall biosynthesis